MIDSLHAYAWADTILFRTNDGSNVWTRISPPVTPILTITFEDSLHGIVVGGWNPNIIARTSDGGKTWDSIRLATHGAIYGSKALGHGAYTLFAWDRGPFFFTYDNFASIDSSVTLPWGSGQVFRNFVQSGDTIIAFGSQQNGGRGLACRTTNRGLDWQNVGEANLTSPSINSVSSPEKERVYLGGGSLGDLLFNATFGDGPWQFAEQSYDTTIYVPGTGVYGMEETPDGHLVGLLIEGPFGAAGWGYLVYGTKVESSVAEPISPAVGLAFPNPSKKAVNIGGINAETVRDALGRNYKVANHDGTLDISSLPPGVYYVSDGKQRARFVKE